MQHTHKGTPLSYGQYYQIMLKKLIPPSLFSSFLPFQLYFWVIEGSPILVQLRDYIIEAPN